MRLFKFRFSVWGLILLTGVCAILIGWTVDHCRLKSDAANAKEQLTKLREFRSRQDIDPMLYVQARVPRTSSRTAWCSKTGRHAYVESNGRRIVVFNPQGESEFIVDPALELRIPPYRIPVYERILSGISFDEAGRLNWSYNTSDFGYVDVEKRTVFACGAD